jgi:hypothetical protein
LQYGNKVEIYSVSFSTKVPYLNKVLKPYFLNANLSSIEKYIDIYLITLFPNEINKFLFRAHVKY